MFERKHKKYICLTSGTNFDQSDKTSQNLKEQYRILNAFRNAEFKGIVRDALDMSRKMCKSSIMPIIYGPAGKKEATNTNANWVTCKCWTNTPLDMSLSLSWPRRSGNTDG